MTGPMCASLSAMGVVSESDALRTPRKVHNLLRHGLIRLPAGTVGWAEPYPEVVVINQMIPVTLRHTLFAGEKSDGETINLISYVRMRPGLAAGGGGAGGGAGSSAGAEGGTQTAVGAPLPPGAKLLVDFLMNAHRDPRVASALKEIGRVTNMDEVASALPLPVAAILRRFNGKPILTTPEQKFYHCEGYLQVA